MEHGIFFDFWKTGYIRRAIDINLLKQAVITENNPNGDITKDEFKEITGEEFKPITTVFNC